MERKMRKTFLSRQGLKMKVVISIFFFLIFTCCENEIELNFPVRQSQLVVEGWIEQNKPAKILLSLSAPFFGAIDSSNIRDYAATRAKITLTCGDKSEILILRPNNLYFPPLYYFSTTIFGKTGNHYNLKIENAGKVYEASTFIPDLTYPDTAWFEKLNTSDTLGLLWLRINDDPLKENYYRTLVRRLGKDKIFIPTLISVFDDKLFNGETFQFSLSRGSSNLTEIGGNRFFEAGDTIILKFCSIDKPHYDFWHSIQSSIITSANPFASNEAEILSNIDGGLGIWGGYAAVYDTIVAK
jgi:hypothetical protein